MLCPVCITFGREVETTTTVNGTQYCSPHGVEALGTTLNRTTRAFRGGATSNVGQVQQSFTPNPGTPAMVTAPTEPLQDAPNPPDAG